MFPCPRSRLRIWSRETGSAVPSRVSLLIIHTQAESGAYSRDYSRFPRRRPFIFQNRHTTSVSPQVYRVTQLRTDGVHCRESAGTGASSPQGSSSDGCCLCSHHHEPINACVLFLIFSVLVANWEKNYSTPWPIPLVVCRTGKREQKKKSGSIPPIPHTARSEKKSCDASTGATQVSVGCVL